MTKLQEVIECMNKEVSTQGKIETIEAFQSLVARAVVKCEVPKEERESVVSTIVAFLERATNE